MQNRPTAQQLDDNIWFTHRTFILPQNGIMIPGGVPIEIPHPGLTKLEFRRETLLYMPNARMTLHWFSQGLVVDHSKATYGDCPYIILEKAANLKTQLYGGYAEDFWLVGPYQLSSQAYILVPVTEFEKAKKELLGFKGVIVGYTSEQQLRQIVQCVIQLNSIYSIQVPPNQTKKYRISVDSILNAKQTLFDDEREKMRSDAKKAQSQGLEYVEIEDPCPAEETRMIVNGTNLLAADFFAAWYVQGLFNDGHSLSIFFTFERSAQALFLTLNKFYLENVRGMKLAESLPDLTLKEYQESKETLIQSLAAIKQELIGRKFPTEVMSYFTDQFDINFREWLSVIDEQIARLKVQRPTIKKQPAFLRVKIAEITDKTGETEQEENKVTIKIEDQSTAALLKSKFKELSFTATKDKVSQYVNVECKISTKADFIKCNMLKKQLLQFGVVSNLINGNSNTLPEKLVIPKMNTAAVQNNIRKAIK